MSLANRLRRLDEEQTHCDSESKPCLRDDNQDQGVVEEIAPKQTACFDPWTHGLSPTTPGELTESGVMRKCARSVLETYSQEEASCCSVWSPGRFERLLTAL